MSIAANQASRRPIIGIVPGDPNGIGPEILVKAWASKALHPHCRPLVIGDSSVIEHAIRLTGLDLATRSISAFDMPRVGTTDDIDWQLNWWARVWQEDLLESVPLLSLAEQWLRAHRKPLDHCSLVHSDYRTGNYLFDERTLTITAMLDWDLGYFGRERRQVSPGHRPELVRGPRLQPARIAASRAGGFPCNPELIFDCAP